MLKLIIWIDWLTLSGGGKGGGAAPPPPDYRGAAMEQGAASRDIAAAQSYANRPTINTPFGQMTWQAGAATDPATGAPVTQWTGNVNLTPEQQAGLESQQRVGAGRSAAAEQLLGQATAGFAQPFDWNALPAAPGSVAEAQKSAYGTMSEMLQPGRQQKQAALETQLANMGLGRGAEAWTRESGNLAEQFGQQDKQMMAQALGEGRANVATQQGLRQAGIAEQAQRRGMTLNELNALLSGQQVSMPQMPSFATAQGGQAPNLLGAAQSTGGYGLDAARLGQQGGADIGSLIGNIAGAAGTAYLASGGTF